MITRLVRPFALAACVAAMLMLHYGCEPLDSDTQGDAQQEPATEETQGADQNAAVDTTHAAAEPAATKAETARLDSIESELHETRDAVKQLRDDVDALKAGGGTAVAPDAQGAYKTALEQFFNRQYEESAAGFRQLLDEGAPPDLRSNCQYWIGECEYGMHQYRAAIASFEKVFTYASSTKYDDAQMMLGMTYLRLNNRARARKEFRKLIEQYPESEFVPRAKRILTTL